MTKKDDDLPPGYTWDIAKVKRVIKRLVKQGLMEPDGKGGYQPTIKGLKSMNKVH